MDEEDYRHFLEVMEQCRAISLFRLYAYCLMGNHIHLLLETVDEPLEQDIEFTVVKVNGKWVEVDMFDMATWFWIDLL